MAINFLNKQLHLEDLTCAILDGSTASGYAGIKGYKSAIDFVRVLEQRCYVNVGGFKREINVTPLKSDLQIMIRRYKEFLQSSLSKNILKEKNGKEKLEAINYSIVTMDNILKLISTYDFKPMKKNPV